MYLLTRLIRFRLSAMVAASALAGYLLCPRDGYAAGAAALTLGIFFLTGACSALNQVQERATDALMERTASRPIPAGRLSPRAGLAAAGLLLVAALLLLQTTRSLPALALGLFAVAWYNGLYTPLKKITSAAILPGALCGALPPVIGWAAAGGSVTDHRIAVLAGVFFLWQIPHFWLLAIRRSEDYRRAGLPTVAQTFTAAQTARITLVWIVALAVGTFLLAAVGPLRQPLPRALCALAAASVLWPAVGRCLGRGPGPSELCLSARPGRFMALLVFALLLEGLLTDYRPFLVSLTGIPIG